MASKPSARLRVKQLVQERADPNEILAALADATAAPGQCRIKDEKHDTGDFPDVMPVLTTTGLMWCCSYGHCFKVTATREDT